jgi:hypothetical protein
MDENEIQARFLLNAGALPGTRLFRNQVGAGWSGKLVKQEKGLVILQNARFVTYGLHPGSSDLIGWHNGRFLSVELKTLTGKARRDQETWLHQVATNGGIARIIKDPDDYLWLKI